ncbi:uncharacterized protein PADG_02882 [Paracoccidioides brasiliensis Pb18]|uniref:Uncharacterized protein n=1 Tax=Paracoccidioides brasiliensis (strain Pb18) TaxID=502780 RepID=C1G6S7_PARBD|nr:uncharacterized protein PADG_02882 [Paracoccidioides brasiliensis Pb18]EEH46784.1 hypothetical protein PADG_02882 [Paracoccidioides brasiliensis Pb18]
MSSTTETSNNKELLTSSWTSYTTDLRNPCYNTSSRLMISIPLSSADSSPTGAGHRHHLSASLNRMYNRGRSGSPFTMHSATSSSRLSSFLHRRRPSAVDLALCEERCRCSEDSIEKIGLGLMEPRPVDPMPIPTAMPTPTVVGDTDASLNMNMSVGQVFDFEPEVDSSYIDSLRIGRQPRFVMGGIFEVMEGSDLGRKS